MSDLLASTHTPTLGGGRALRVYGVARALAAHAPLDMVYVRFGAERPAREFEEMAGLTLHPVEPSRGARRAWAYAGGRGRGVPHGFARGISPELVRTTEALADRPGRGRVVAEGPIAAAALRRLARRRSVIYCAHNVESAFRHEGLDARGLGSRQTLTAFERGVLARASESWMVSNADMELARALAPGARLRLVPNVVDVAAIAPVPLGRPQGRILMVADFTYEPNVRGLDFVAGEVMPLVWAQEPEARLVVVGRGLSAPPSADARVQTLGFVEDLPGAYGGADCAVVPLREGGGSPLKFVEALAYGLPVVATPRAAAGLTAEAGTHYLEGDDPAAFAAALVDVLRRGAPEVARRGRALAETEYSIEALMARLAPADDGQTR